MSTIVFQHRNEIQTTTERFTENIPTFEKVLKEWNDLSLGEIQDRQEFLQCVNQPEQFLNARIDQRISEGAAPEIAGFKLKSAAILAMIDTGERQQLLDACKLAKHQAYLFERCGNLKKGKFFIDKTYLDQYIKSCTTYAITPREVAVHEAMLLICEGMSGLVASHSISKESFDRPLSQLIGINEGRFAPNVSAFVAMSR
jgi:hypothetical protein